MDKMAENITLPFFANTEGRICNMKKKIIAAAMATVATVAGSFCNTIDTGAANHISNSTFHDDDTIITPTERGIYATTMMVSHIDHDVITVVDTQGNEFEFLTDAPDYEINDLVACTMDNMGTTTILDDVLINAYYSGNITDFQEVAK